MSTSTRVSGAIIVIWRVASTPLIPGMFEVHDDDVGRDLADGGERLGPGLGLADDVDALLLEQRSQARAEEVVVVDQEHAG